MDFLEICRKNGNFEGFWRGNRKKIGFGSEIRPIYRFWKQFFSEIA